MTDRGWTTILCAGGAIVSVAAVVAYTTYCHRTQNRRTISSVVSPPHPDWKLGDRQESPYKSSEVVHLDPSEITAAQCYPLVISGIVPRPIAFVSSLSDAGVGNLAPFSYFGAMAHDPPCVAISVCRSSQRDGNEKDTAKNIMDTREFVVNIISEWFVESANYTCSPFNADISEMEIVNLTPIPSIKVKPPRIGESAIQMECRLLHHYDIHNKSGAAHATVFIGEVVMFHLNKDVLTTTPSGNIAVDVLKLQPMCRLGGNMYGHITSIFHLPRPDRTV